MASVLSPGLKQARKAKRAAEVGALMADAERKVAKEADSKGMKERLERGRNRGGTLLGGREKQKSNVLGSRVEL